MAIQQTLNEKQGHWVLAKVGKKVLRPGGRELTEKLINALNISHEDDVVEFAPGLGFTANLTCARRPHSYIGVDHNREAAELARKSIHYNRAMVIVADAAHTTLPDESATVVYGEAMLTMQPQEHKRAIIREAVRILKPGGYYGIHEMGLQPDNISDEIKQNVYKDLSANIRVHARPLATSEWAALLEQEGFEIVKVETSPMALLEPKRVVQDEGVGRSLKIAFNVLTQPVLRKRITQMRHTFKKYRDDINAIAIVARKK